ACGPQTMSRRSANETVSVWHGQHAEPSIPSLQQKIDADVAVVGVGIAELTKIAAYRDEPGNLHERLAVCAHPGCIVHRSQVRKPGIAPVMVSVLMERDAC